MQKARDQPISEPLTIIKVKFFETLGKSLNDANSNPERLTE